MKGTFSQTDSFFMFFVLLFVHPSLSLSQELPAPVPVKTRLPAELFGDALMVLEFLQAFGELFDLKDEFPEGVSLGEARHLALLIFTALSLRRGGETEEWQQYGASLCMFLKLQLMSTFRID